MPSRTYPRRAGVLLGRLADFVASDALVDDLGAGPLEDFVRAHAPKIIAQIERRASVLTERIASEHARRSTRSPHLTKRVWSIAVCKTRPSSTVSFGSKVRIS